MIEELYYAGVLLVIVAVFLIAFALLGLSRSGVPEQRESKGYAVFLLGPIPIVLKGSVKLALIAFFTSLLVILAIFLLLAS